MRSFIKLAGVIWLGLLSNSSMSQTIAIQNATIAACKDLRIKFNGVPPASGANGNWISISQVGTPDNVQSFRFKYLPQAASTGIVALSTRGLNPFTTYEIRLYLDWAATHSFSVAARQTFNIQASDNCLAPLLAFVDNVVTAGQPVNFGFTDTKVVTSNWVGLARPSETAPHFLKWKKLQAADSGENSIDTTGLAPGTYELRLFEDWEGTREYYIYDRATIQIK